MNIISEKWLIFFSIVLHPRSLLLLIKQLPVGLTRANTGQQETSKHQMLPYLLQNLFIARFLPFNALASFSICN
jgi:hypothetical protein